MMPPEPMVLPGLIRIAPGVMRPDWALPAGVRACVTTREGGFSAAPYATFNLGDHVGDDPAAVRANRARLRAQLPVEPLWLSQVHGVRVADADREDGRPEADAVLARTSRRACAVLTADCLPVLFCTDDGAVVAAAHAGWRGLAAGVLERTLEAMQAAPARVLVWLGPAIGPRAFEVGEEVRAAFVADDPAAVAAFVPGVASGKWMADIFALARRRLQRAGVTRIAGGGLSTVLHPASFYSYRRDGCTGRFASLIWREGDAA